MATAGALHNRRHDLRALCVSAALLLGPASSAVAQNTDTRQKQETQQSEHKPWTSESHNDPDRDRAPRYQGPRFPNRVSGIVRFASGDAPYPPAEIFLCGQPVGSTNEKGRFSVSAPYKPASNVFSERCYVSIHYPGAKSISVRVGQISSGYNRTINVGVKVLEPLPGFEGSMTSATTRAAPKPALRAFQKGVREEAKSKPNLEKAATHLEQAVGLFPRFAEAWTALGRVRLRMEDVDSAMPALETAIAADESFPPPYRLLLRVVTQHKELSRAVFLAEKLLRLIPGDNEAQYYHTLATFGLQRYDEAMSSAQALIDAGAGEQYPQALRILGEIQADRGEIDNAVRSFLSYLELAPDAPSAQRIRERLREWGYPAADPAPLVTRLR